MSGFGSTSFVRFGLGWDGRIGSGGRSGVGLLEGQAVAVRAAEPFLVSFLVRLDGRFFVPTCRSGVTPRAGAVEDGRRPPPEAARSVLDGGEHGVTVLAVGTSAICTAWAV